MAKSGPMTLKDVRETLQLCLDTGQHEIAIKYIQLLERHGINVNYAEETNEDRIDEINRIVKEELVKYNISKTDATSLIKNYPIKETELSDANSYLQRLYAIHYPNLNNIRK